MKLPRDLNAANLLKALKPLGYVVTRQKGSHIRITTTMHGEHHEVIPNHTPIKIGTLRGIIGSIAAHHKMSIADVVNLMFR